MEIRDKAPMEIQAKIEKRKEHIPAAYNNIASGMEKQFLEYMLEKMKATISDEEVSTGQDYYSSLQTAEQAKAIAENGNGMGIKEMILNQIYPKTKRNALNVGRNPYINQKGGNL